MKKLLSLLFKLALCVVALAVGVYIANTVADVIDPWKDKVPEKVTEYGSPYKVYYDNLTDLEKHAYNEIITNIYSMPEKIRIPALDKYGIDNVFSAILADNPDLFFIGRKCYLISQGLYTYCSVEYYIDSEEYTGQKKKLDEACNEVISSLSEPDDEFRTELEIHDYIVNNCVYRLEKNEFVYSSAYGAIVNGEAGCEGYSKAMKLLLDMAGIESSVVSGISTDTENNTSSHMWNVVNINGDYYHLDCTWDDPVSDSGKEILSYSYFNLSDEMIADTHSDFSYDFGCDATAENYFIKNKSYFESYGRSDEKRVSGIIAETVNGGSREVYLSFADKEAYDSAVSELIDSRRIYKVLRNAKKNTKVKISTDSVSCMPDPDRRILTFIIE